MRSARPLRAAGEGQRSGAVVRGFQSSPVVFEGSAGLNIEMGKPGPAPEEIERVCGLAKQGPNHDALMALDGVYASFVRAREN